METESNLGGRPTDYKPEFDEMAYKLCLLGFTDKQLGDFFEVTEQTVNNWKKAHPAFFESIKKGKYIADGEVVASLYKRATGYRVTEVHKMKSETGGIALNLEIDGDGDLTADPSHEDSTITKYVIKEMPPDVTAQIFWLKNRQPELWRDKIDITSGGEKLPEAPPPVNIIMGNAPPLAGSETEVDAEKG